MPDMAEHALFYNSKNGDRVYDASSFEHLLKKFFTSGVFVGDLTVRSDEGMSVSVGTGYCNCDGKVRFFSSAGYLPIATAHATLTRTDAIVAERNDTERDITLKVVAGTPGGPAPIPVRSGGIYQLVLAHVAVPGGVSRVTQDMIIDTRLDADICGAVTSAVSSPDFSEQFLQFRAQFDEWFAEVRETLSEDVAGHLMNLIVELQNRVPQPGAGDSTKYLRGDGTWNAPIKTVTFSMNASDIGALSVTKAVAGVKQNMVVLNANIDSGVQGSAWSVTMGSGTVTIDGSISSAGNVTLVLGESENAKNSVISKPSISPAIFPNGVAFSPRIFGFYNGGKIYMLFQKLHRMENIRLVSHGAVNTAGATITASSLAVDPPSAGRTNDFQVCLTVTASGGTTGHTYGVYIQDLVLTYDS